MALLNSWDNSNKVINQGLSISYSKRMIRGAWETIQGPVQVASFVQSIAWEYHRYATKTYEYVGMDYNTALSCQNAMITKYTRTCKTTDYYQGDFVDVQSGAILMADIAVQKMVGCMYKVVVSVREDDSRLRFQGTIDPTTLFTTENNRDYD